MPSTRFGSLLSTLPLLMGLLSLAPAPLAGQQITNVVLNSRDILHNQAIIRFTAPDSTTPCTYQISTSPDLNPTLPFLNPDLFPGANQDGAYGGRNRFFVAGRQGVARGADGRNYSLTLFADTQHFWQAQCGDQLFRGSFTTAKIPYGRTYPVLPISYVPDLKDRRDRISDPATGARVQLLTEPQDLLPSSLVRNPVQAGWPESGSTEVCHPKPVLRNNLPGHHCLVPTTLNRLLYWIPAGEGDAAFLGELPANASLFNFTRTVFAAQVNFDPEDPNVWYGVANTVENGARLYRLLRYEYRAAANPNFTVALVSGREGNLTELSGGLLHPDRIDFDLARGESSGGARPFMAWSFGPRDICNKAWYVALYFPARTNPVAAAELRLVGAHPGEGTSTAAAVPKDRVLHFAEVVPGTDVVSLVLNHNVKYPDGSCGVRGSEVPGFYWNHSSGEVIAPDPNPPTGGHNIFRQAGSNPFEGLFITGSYIRADADGLPGNHVWDVWNSVDGKRGNSSRRATTEVNPMFAGQRGHCFPNWCQSHPFATVKLGTGPAAGLDNIPFVGYKVLADTRQPLFPQRPNSTLHIVGFRQLEATKLPVTSIWGFWSLRFVTRIVDGPEGYFTMCRFWGGEGNCGLSDQELEQVSGLTWGDLIVNLPIAATATLPDCFQTVSGALPARDFCSVRIAPSMNQIMEIGLEPTSRANPWRYVRPLSSNLMPLRLDGGFANSRFSPGGHWVITAGVNKRPVHWPAGSDVDEADALGPTNGYVTALRESEDVVYAGVQLLVKQNVTTRAMRVALQSTTDQPEAEPRLSLVFQTDGTLAFFLRGQRVCGEKEIRYQAGDTVTMVNRAPSYFRWASVNDQIVCNFQLVGGTAGAATGNFAETDRIRLLADVPEGARLGALVDSSSPVYLIRMPAREAAGETDPRYTDLVDYQVPWLGSLRHGYSEFAPAPTPLLPTTASLACQQGRTCLQDATSETIWPLIPGKVVWLAREAGQPTCAFISWPDAPDQARALCGGSANATGETPETGPPSPPQ